MGERLQRTSFPTKEGGNLEGRNRSADPRRDTLRHTPGRMFTLPVFRYRRSPAAGRVLALAVPNRRAGL